VFGLIVANDPTADVSAFKKNTGTSHDRGTAKKKDEASAPERKAEIPAAFIKEWEFKISRDEALYDMQNQSALASIRQFLNRLRLFKQSGEVRKWQVLRTGKSSDEQLWGVRPPRYMLAHPFIREWLRKTLESAGYDSEKMASEWEIFWRRKGLC
jgi:hypothetical protein